MIKVSGAREHNLDNIEVEFGEGVTAVTGVSGSGKTSLVFDTLYHEARRRFLETYAIGAVAERLAPANVGDISGLGPAVALGQNLLNRNPNSTLASATGLAPFLRILYARFGRRSCPDCSAELVTLSEDESVERLVAHSGEGSCLVYASLLRGVPGSHRTLLQHLEQEFGTAALRVDDTEYPQKTALDPGDRHNIAVLLSDSKSTLSAVEARDVVQRVRTLGSVVMHVLTAARKLRFLV
jgi:excinuclease ABC subunit A